MHRRIFNKGNFSITLNSLKVRFPFKESIAYKNDTELIGNRYIHTECKMRENIRSPITMYCVKDKITYAEREN